MKQPKRVEETQTQEGYEIAIFGKFLEDDGHY